jgi:hypothetical protein
LYKNLVNQSRLPLPEIMFAARILKAMKEAHSVSQTGAVGLDGKMIDAPMIKQVFQFHCTNCPRDFPILLRKLLQARRIIAMAEAANLEIQNLL